MIRKQASFVVTMYMKIILLKPSYIDQQLGLGKNASYKYMYRATIIN